MFLRTKKKAFSSLSFLSLSRVKRIDPLSTFIQIDPVTILAINRESEEQRLVWFRAPETQPRETRNINTNDTIVISRVAEAWKVLKTNECDCRGLFSVIYVFWEFGWSTMKDKRVWSKIKEKENNQVTSSTMMKHFTPFQASERTYWSTLRIKYLYQPLL